MLMIVDTIITVQRIIVWLLWTTIRRRNTPMLSFKVKLDQQ